jgi:rhomboid protease GluP
MQLSDCPHCATRVVMMADGICPACRKSVYDEPLPQPPDEPPQPEQAWETFQRSLQPTAAAGPLQAFRNVEAELADVRILAVGSGLRRGQTNPAAAERIRQQLLPQLEAAFDRAREPDSGTDTAVCEFLAMRLESWQHLAEALQTGDAAALRRHAELWETADLQAVGLSADAQSLAEPDQRLAIDFENALVTFTPRVIVTPALVAINVLVFIAMVASGVHAFAPTAGSVLAWGANYGPKTMDGQWWRLVTNAFLHFGLLHLAFNMWILWDLGRLMERLVGNFGFAVLYLVSGIAGSLASLAWNPHVVSAGASGAVFGVAGAMLSFMALRKDTIPAGVLRHFGGSLTAFVIFNVLFGLRVEGIDNAAHLGGLVAGLVGGLLLSQPLSVEMVARRPRHNVALLALGGVALPLAAVALPAAPADVLGELARFGDVEVATLETHQQLVGRAVDGTLSDLEFADRVDRDILPLWQSSRHKFEAIEDATPEQRAMLAPLVTYMRTREAAWQMMVEGLRAQDIQTWEKSQQRWLEADALARQMATQ